MTPRTLRILLVAYGVKALIVGVAWILVPDLPSRTASTLRQAWERVKQ